MSSKGTYIYAKTTHSHALNDMYDVILKNIQIKCGMLQDSGY